MPNSQPSVPLWGVIVLLVGVAVAAFGFNYTLHASQSTEIKDHREQVGAQVADLRGCKVEKTDYRNDKAAIHQALRRIEDRQIEMIRQIGRANGKH